MSVFVQYYGGQLLDACRAVAAIAERLTTDGFVARYPTVPEVDGLPPGEAAFLPCSFWPADNLALQVSTTRRASCSSGCLAVRDRRTRRMIGNFPRRCRTRR